jgi:hypothetical protein
MRKIPLLFSISVMARTGVEYAPSESRAFILLWLTMNASEYGAERLNLIARRSVRSGDGSQGHQIHVLSGLGTHLGMFSHYLAQRNGQTWRKTMTVEEIAQKIFDRAKVLTWEQAQGVATTMLESTHGGITPGDIRDVTVTNDGENLDIQLHIDFDRTVIV